MWGWESGCCGASATVYTAPCALHTYPDPMAQPPVSGQCWPAKQPRAVPGAVSTASSHLSSAQGSSLSAHWLLLPDRAQAVTGGKPWGSPTCRRHESPGSWGTPSMSLPLPHPLQPCCSRRGASHVFITPVNAFLASVWPASTLSGGASPRSSPGVPKACVLPGAGVLRGEIRDGVSTGCSTPA